MPRPRPTLAEKRVRRHNRLLAFASFLLAEARSDGDRCLAFLVIQRALGATRSGRKWQTKFSGRSILASVKLASGKITAEIFDGA